MFASEEVALHRVVASPAEDYNEKTSVVSWEFGAPPEVVPSRITSDLEPSSKGLSNRTNYGKNYPRDLPKYV